ncbi:MAG: phosphoribosylamine--glycine ligase [Marinilabiliales bacterium]
MNILLIGSGGREHALAWKIKQSKYTDKLYIAPGNAGTRELGENVKISPENFNTIKQFVLDKNIEMIVVGPEAPLVEGITDFFNEDPETQHILMVGPGKSGAMLEGSKDFAKHFMQKYNIPTAKYKSFNIAGIEDGKKFLESLSAPYVLKADGLAAGKGVVILDDLDIAKATFEDMLKGKFGSAGNTVLIEEFLKGVECSVFVLTDGKSFVLLPEAKDYKRIGENDTGLNTGGMGAISPVPFADDEFMSKVIERIIKPTINGIADSELNYKGFIFFGLMNVNGNPYVIEYNVRMGDPESEVVIPRIESDIVEMFIYMGNNKLNEYNIKISQKAATTVMLVSGGYPEKYEKNKKIIMSGNIDDAIVFHAGTSYDNENLVTSGGRVLSVTAFGNSIKDATDNAYKNVENVKFENMYFRRDIGKDLL